MKKVLIGTGLTTQAYAPVAGALTTADAATDMGILASGAIGVYGFIDYLATDTYTQTGLQPLVTVAAATAAGKVIYSDFATANTNYANNTITIAQGGTQPVVVSGIMRNGITRVNKKAYVAPVREVTFIGYDGASGLLNLPTVLVNDEGVILAIQKEATTTDMIREQEQYNSGALAASASAYAVVAPLANSVNTKLALYKTQTAFVTSNGSQADWVGAGTAIKFTKGSTTVGFYIEDATGFIASTGTIAVGAVIGVAHSNMLSVTFTASALGTSAGQHIITIGGTIYVVNDTGTTATHNAAAIVLAINAGSQATATNVSADVTIILNNTTVGQKILAVSSPDGSAFTNIALTVNTTTGDTLGSRYTAVTAAATGTDASFELDYAYWGETGYYYGGTSLTLNAGVVTSITQYGMKWVSDDPSSIFEYAKQGVLQYATTTYSVYGTMGFGSGAEVVKIEEGLIAYRGQFDTFSKWAKQLPRFADATKNYDCYTIAFTNSTPTTGPTSKSTPSAIQIYLPTGQAASTSFATIIKGLTPFTNF